ncbi:flagellar biosynthesis anti-sigma factor FlgM [Paenibacillus pinistramenti]|uniref:flagellar biosynthesis anti-sigma factor FlgM n=1 Tax=Paenibacillus pinistramenti TaxID=1768003 RepID=UPI00110834F6|nr:flagellar biosynthesis anti-sigma factor FlgM [Paenibacillus pinistramenti]
MKINETGRVGAINSYQRQVDNQRTNDDKKTKRKDEVSISSEAMELLKANDKTAESGNSERIQQLKEQVSSGTYQVEAGKIAEKLAPYFTQYLKNGE